MWENSAVEMLLDKINNLTRRIEMLEAKINPTYTSCTSIPITATHGSYWSIWATPTISRTEAVAYRNVYEDRLHDIERQLDDLSNVHYEIRDGNLYITWINNDWATD